MAEHIREPAQSDVGKRRVVLDKRGFRHIGTVMGFDGRGRLIVNSEHVQTGLSSWGRTWDDTRRLEVIEDARILDTKGEG